MDSTEQQDLGFFIALLHYAVKLTSSILLMMLLSWAIDLTSIAEETKKSILTGSFIILYLLTGVNLSQSVRRKVAYHIDTKYSAVAYWLLWPLLYPILLLRYGTHKMLG